MTTNTTIQTAIFQAVKTYAAAKNLPVAYPSVPFVPPSSGQWLELIFLPNTDLGRPINSGGNYAPQGLFRVNCCDRQNTGALQLSTLADDVVAAFPMERVLVDSVRVSGKPQQTPLDAGDGVMRVSVTVAYIG